MDGLGSEKPADSQPRLHMEDPWAYAARETEPVQRNTPSALCGTKGARVLLGDVHRLQHDSHGRVRTYMQPLKLRRPACIQIGTDASDTDVAVLTMMLMLMIEMMMLFLMINRVTHTHTHTHTHTIIH